MAPLTTQCWLLTRDVPTADAVSAALQPVPGLSPVGLCATIPELIDGLTRIPTRIALVDLDVAPVAMLRELEPVVARFDATRFVMLCTRLSSETLLAAMQIGVRQCVQKSNITAELPRAAAKLAAAGSARAKQHGSAVTILSAGGGCGATTLAVNLANELAAITGSCALVIDLDAAYGSVAEYLGLEGRYGVADLLVHEHRIDPALVTSTALPRGASLHALISPASVSPEDPPPLAWSRIGPAVQACREAYTWTVIDAPRIPLAAAAELAALSRATLVLAQLCVKDLRMARLTLAGLERRGIPASTLLPIASRYARRVPMVELEEARRALGPSLQTLTSDFRVAVESLNFGKLLAESAPRSVLRREIARLAQHLVDSPAEAPASAPAHAALQV